MEVIHVHEHDGRKYLYFMCPGCKSLHCVVYPGWTWNEDLVHPTLSPSILTGRGKNPDGQPSFEVERCHSYIVNGQIQFLDDCYHELKNQTVPLPVMDDDARHNRYKPA